VTIAGDGDVLDDIARQLDEAGVTRRPNSPRAPSSSACALDGLSSHAGTLPLNSTVTGERLDDYTAGAAYWWQNLRATVLFESAMRRLLDNGYTHLLELGTTSRAGGLHHGDGRRAGGRRRRVRHPATQ
jgi:acyl transferase domain-containing protein